MFTEHGHNTMSELFAAGVEAAVRELIAACHRHKGRVLRDHLSPEVRVALVVKGLTCRKLVVGPNQGRWLVVEHSARRALEILKDLDETPPDVVLYYAHVHTDVIAILQNAGCLTRYHSDRGWTITHGQWSVDRHLQGPDPTSLYTGSLPHDVRLFYNNKGIQAKPAPGGYKFTSRHLDELRQRIETLTDRDFMDEEQRLRQEMRWVCMAVRRMQMPRLPTEIWCHIAGFVRIAHAQPIRLNWQK
jgi:hypothetical protein